MQIKFRECLLPFSSDRIFCLHSKNLKIKKMLPLVLYGSETWSLTVREEHRLKVFKNRVLRRIFGHKRDRERERK